MAGLARHIVKILLQRLLTFLIILTIIWGLTELSFIITGKTPFDQLLERREPGVFQQYLYYLDRFGYKYDEELGRPVYKDPIYIRYFKFLKSVFTFDFGPSARHGLRPVSEVILERLPWTISLVGSAFIFGSMIGLALGTYLARKRGTLLDISMTWLIVGIRALPVFWLGLLLLYLFSSSRGWFPWGLETGVTRAPDIGSHMVAWFWMSILPMLTLSKIYAVQYLLVVRNMTTEEMTQDYVVTLRAAGLPEDSIFNRYIFRAVAPSIITLMAIDLGFVFGGAVVTETIFHYPGVGSLLYDAMKANDQPLIIGGFTIITLAVLIAITIAEMLYSYLDPRIRR
ncbi:ABC transporter permease [Desulfurococcaceae archaeon MEX13E-LK6-19]|nr:ABC transporter permease [Desulfurococcaceae archaeon MEX13E-LK6-19]